MTTVDTIDTPQASNHLPEGWRIVKFGDVVRSVKVNVDPEASGLERYIAGEHMDTDNLHIRRWGTVGDGYLGPAFHRKFVKGQVLYGSRRTYLRKVAVAEFDGICANTTFVLEPKNDELLPELLPFIMQTDAFNEHSVKQSKGSVNPYVNFSDLEWYDFALPPKDEQRRIAEILWAADEAVQRTQTVIQQMYGFHYELTNQLVNNGLNHVQYKNSEIGEIPETWEIKRITELVSSKPYSLLAGPFGTIFKAKDFREVGVPIIQIRHITQRGFDWGDTVTFMDEQVYERIHQPYTVYSGDLLVTKLGDPPGAACLYPEGQPYAMVTPDVIKCTLDHDKIDNRFAVFMYNNRNTQMRLMRLIKDGTRPRMTLNDFYALPLAIPPLEEQQHIAEILTSADKGIKLQENHREQLRLLLGKLRENLLKRTIG